MNRRRSTAPESIATNSSFEEVAESRRKRLSLAEQAYQRIEEMIVTLELLPGSATSETELSARIGIGRTPVREALQRLAADHLVKIMPQRAAVIAEVTIKDQLRVLEVRRPLERLIAAAAAARSTGAERLEFLRMADAMSGAAEVGDSETFLRIDHQFNLFIARCASNRFASTAIAPLHAMSRRFWYIHYKQTGDLKYEAELHGAIMRAVAAGDGETSAAAAGRLMDYIASFTRATLEDDIVLDRDDA